MTEISVLYLFLAVAFVLASLMTKNFFLGRSVLYSRALAGACAILLIGLVSGINWSAGIWLLFCLFGFYLYLKQEGRRILSASGLATCIPFVFSLIAASWFFAGVNDLGLLGYNKNWSLYAALHGSVLGWFFVGCLAYLSRHSEAIRAKSYMVGCYLCVFLFLLVAFGINGIPYIKRIGVIGFTFVVPFSIALFMLDPKKGTPVSSALAIISFFSIVASMGIAITNEFWGAAIPKIILGMPVMTVTHGLLNVMVALPCFYLAIRLSAEKL